MNNLTQMLIWSIKNKEILWKKKWFWEQRKIILINQTTGTIIFNIIFYWNISSALRVIYIIQIRKYKRQIWQKIILSRFQIPSVAKQYTFTMTLRKIRANADELILIVYRKYNDRKYLKYIHLITNQLIKIF